MANAEPPGKGVQSVKPLSGHNSDFQAPSALPCASENAVPGRAFALIKITSMHKVPA